jgi:hypothetical protein
MNRWRLISLVPLLLLAALLSGCRSTAAVPKIERKQDVQLGTTTSATSAVQLDMYAASSSVVAGQTIAFTVTFKNDITTEATLITPCGHPFNLQVNADDQEIDDWLRQTYGGPPACPPGHLIVPAGGSYNTTLSLRFPTPGTFSVYAVTLSGGNLLSNQVTIHVR